MFSGDISMYLYNVETSGLAQSKTVALDLWFCWLTFVLIFSAGTITFVGSMLVGNNGRSILVFAGMLSLFSLAIFAVTLHSELSKTSPIQGLPQVGVLSSGSFTWMEIPYMDYRAYPTFGFWLALVSAILTLSSSFKHPIPRQCSLCKKEIFKSFECPSCQFRICVPCSVDNHWKCPQCNADLIPRMHVHEGMSKLERADEVQDLLCSPCKILQSCFSYFISLRVL